MDNYDKKWVQDFLRVNEGKLYKLRDIVQIYKTFYINEDYYTIQNNGLWLIDENKLYKSDIENDDDLSLVRCKFVNIGKFIKTKKYYKYSYIVDFQTKKLKFDNRKIVWNGDK